MEVGCRRVLGLISLVITNMGCILAFFTPYWILYNGNCNSKGLLARCEQQQCHWFLEDVISGQQSEPEWYMATQGLMSVGLALGLIALLIATLSLCCTCHKCNPHPPISGLLACAGIAMAIGCVVFGVKANQAWSIKLEWDSFASGRFGWSFWVGVAASVLSLLTSGIYGCIGRSSS